MVKPAIPVVAYFIFEGIALCFAECQSGVCKESMSDDFSLIQGLVEPDFAKPSLHAPGQGLNLDSQFDAATTTTPLVQGTTVSGNSNGDLKAVLSATFVGVAGFSFFCFVFSVGQTWYPKMFQYRVLKNWKNGVANAGGFHEEYKPEEFADDDEIRSTTTWFGWVGMAFAMSSEEIEESSGLDAALIIKFSDLSIELMLTFGLPFCIIGIPLYACLGGGAAGGDSLSWAGISNIVWNSTSVTKKPMSKEDAETPECPMVLVGHCLLRLACCVLDAASPLRLPKSLHQAPHRMAQSGAKASLHNDPRARHPRRQADRRSI
jgi:hypothetical protein